MQHDQAFTLASSVDRQTQLLLQEGIKTETKLAFSVGK